MQGGSSSSSGAGGEELRLTSTETGIEFARFAKAGKTLSRHDFEESFVPALVRRHVLVRACDDASDGDQRRRREKELLDSAFRALVSQHAHLSLP